MDRVIVMGSVFLPGFVMDPLVRALRARGLEAERVVPTPLGTPQAIGEAYAAAAAELGATAAIAHSNAGNFVPAVAAGSAVNRIVFLDAVIPPLRGGTWPVMPARARRTLPVTARDGILPPWTRWWPEESVRPLFPDDATFALVDAGAPSIPAAYLSSRVSAPRNWTAGLRCSYVAFGHTYADEVGVATGAGWPVRALELGHLGILQDPAMVADAVLYD
ncbi:hypothetical protein NQ166_10765 [Microbacterium sp. zg.Y1090]|uniref:hypothetical protein n=1 Tax=Microbacterium TaxID=33882 RepID=UPI00214B4D3F|nr:MULTISPECIES: hypothetical protein [unclassified Microbacterium]MCR2814032.1 hypothetical protein [Microbacterium sp. zg.Y1084]MCR2819306.1 hypothetical protein [Microbacterium sp. zg.Y1090]MDL5487223.1 hypothetical protein [Microbacterium sp. zg-Y1211]WIM28288.1 hypothetical protein QNO26_14265 [Microbacterium sp. zg-Y1090]